MGREEWASFLHDIKRERAASCFVLNPDSTKAELAQVEQALGGALPSASVTALEHWNEHGSSFLLTAVPRMINPFAADVDLDPAGMAMRTLYPEFCRMLDRTERFAVIVDPTIGHEQPDSNVLFAGLGRQLIPHTRDDRTRYWAFYLPRTLETIRQHEVKSGVPLSPQLRQILLRANGAPEAVCPYFTPLEWLEKGILADLYQGFWAEIDSPEPFERLETFVSLYANGSGDYQGFFPDEERQDGEYKIYDWDHEVVRFTIWAPNFAGWLERILIQGG